jgi:teichuronic acid biosynthesis glycosyltransferase TuaC
MMRVLAITNMYPTPNRPWSGTFVEQQIQGLRSRGVECHVVVIDRLSEGPWAYYRMRPRLNEAVAVFQPHLVHVMYGGVMARKVLDLRLPKPVVVTFHGSDLLGADASGWFRNLQARYGVHCSRMAARRARGVVIVARHLARELPPQVNPRTVRIIPCGIELDRFKPMDQGECRRKLGWAENDFHVLFPANNGDPVKRPWLAEAAVQRLAGQGVKTELHQLRGLANEEVPLWLNAANALLLTSLHEGSPTVVKEALSCGLPVVSVDVGDVAERIAGIEGCHLAAADPGDLAGKLRQVWQRNSRVDGRSRLQALSIGCVAERLKAFYQEILEGVTLENCSACERKEPACVCASLRGENEMAR